MNLAIKRLWLRTLRRIGKRGVAGITLLVAAAALAAWLPHLRESTDDSIRLAAARRLATAQHEVSRPVAISEADATGSFVASFPALAQNSSDVATIFDTASQHRITLLKGEYQLKVEPNAPFIVYTATFPVHGTYEALRGFSADVLTSLPHVALDELRISRDAAGSTALDAMVRFTVFYRSH